MRDELARFLESVRNDPRRLEELRALISTPDAAIRWAGDQGFHLTPEDIAELRESEGELSDHDLDQVAGGEDAWVPGPDDGTTGGVG
jgi:predicted ribosomally synthesized peptide with nif11-like leader